MITKFKKYNLVKESPDNLTYNDNIYSIDKDDNIPFFVVTNTNHTKVEDTYIGENRSYHSELEIRPEMSRYDRTYPGRLWMKPKVITFWVYPNVELFLDIVKHLEKKLNIKMFNNNWKIEVLTIDDEIHTTEYDPYEYDYYNKELPRGEIKVVPIEDYVGSENLPEELQIQHLMNWKEKELAKKLGKIHFGKWGSYKTGWDQPHNIKYRQAIYQENKKS